jgi:chromosome segregation ATPase
MNSIKRGPQFPHRDFAEALQARIRSDPDGEAPAAAERGTVELLRAHMAALEAALAKAEELGKHREHEIELVTSRVADLQAHIATLEAALANADVAGKHWQREAESGAKRVNDLVAELFKVTRTCLQLRELFTRTDRNQRWNAVLWWLSKSVVE